MRLARDIVEGETLAVAGELTYKLMLSLFPFLTFALSLLGFLNLDITMLGELAALYLPYDIHAMMIGFVYGLVQERNGAVLSVSLVIALASSSSGCRSMMRGISKAHGIRDERGFAARAAVSLALTLMFAAAMAVAVAANMLDNAVLSGLGVFAAVLAAVVIVYRVSVPGKRVAELLPGGVLTVVLWILSSQVFNVYVSNFAVFSLYGSIAGAFILLLWLNVVSVIILLGAHLNAGLGAVNTDLQSKQR